MTGTSNGTDSLVLFPGGVNISAGSVTLRHTHSARVIISSGGIDVWLDGTRVITGATNTLSLGATATLSFLPNAQCYFHEAAAWPRALSSSDHTQLSLCMARWPVGPRYAANGILFGQSNAGYEYNNSFALAQRLVAYWTGRLSTNLMQNAINASNAGSSIFSGRGIYGAAGDTTNLLTNAGDGTPSDWVYGNCGTQFQTMIADLSADLLAGVSYIAWFWSETDSTRAYSEKTLFEGAVRRAWALIRQTMGRTAAQLPILVISALPFQGSDGGCQMLREVMADLVADSSQNCSWMLQQSTDAIGLGDTWNSATGAESGAGNGAHRDAVANNTFAVRMALPIAQAVMASASAAGTADALTSFPAALNGPGGPSITSAHYEGTAYAATGSVLVTVTHSNGASDLIVPLQAAVGAGWTIMDGGSPASPGTLVAATACARVSSTTLRIVLAQTLAHASTALLYYPYGQALTSSLYAVIGQGNAVTDNFSAVTLPAGWQIGSDAGSGNQPNFPLRTPAYGIALT